MASKSTKRPIEVAISMGHTVLQTVWIERVPSAVERWLTDYFTEKHCKSIRMASKSTKLPREVAVSTGHTVGQFEWLERVPSFLQG